MGVRELRTIETIIAGGTTPEQVRWALKQGRWTRIINGVFGRGPEEVSALDLARATALKTGGVVRRLSAAALLDFDGIEAGAIDVAILRAGRSRLAGVHRVTALPDWMVAHQVRCTPGAQTLFDIARFVDDDTWEQALEFCLRMSHVAPHEIPDMWDGPSEAARRIRRVVAARGGLEIPHTDSILETLAVQLLRANDLPTPIRQHRLVNDLGQSRYIDLCWPELGIFLELDGQGHRHQPVYDATRQNEITRMTGWRCIRLTWEQVRLRPTVTAHEMRELLAPLVR